MHFPSGFSLFQEMIFKENFSKSTCFIKDTHREKAPSNKIPALTKSPIGIWFVDTSNKLLIRSS